MKLRFEVVAVLCAVILGLTYIACVYVNTQDHTFISEFLANRKCFLAFVRFCFACMYKRECRKR